MYSIEDCKYFSEYKILKVIVPEDFILLNVILVFEMHSSEEALQSIADSEYIKHFQIFFRASLHPC